MNFSLYTSTVIVYDPKTLMSRIFLPYINNRHHLFIILPKFVQKPVVYGCFSCHFYLLFKDALLSAAVNLLNNSGDIKALSLNCYRVLLW